MNAQMQDPAPRLGVFTDEPADAYYVRRLDEASNSGLAVIDERSPAHYRYWVEHPDGDEDESAALAFGKAFHLATLEPERFGDCYTVLPDDMPRDLRYLRNAGKPSDATKAAIATWDEWEARSAGRVTMTRANYDLAVAMATSLRGYVMEFPGGVTMTGAELFDACQKEVTLRWVDEETGILCKLRADLHEPELAFAGDLKSARDGSREAFSRAINSHRYHVQHCHYADGFRVCGAPLKSFAFFPVEKTAPYVPASWHIDAVSEERGWAIRQRSMRKLDACLKSGRWPGHTTTIESIGIPPFGHYDAKDA